MKREGFSIPFSKASMHQSYPDKENTKKQRRVHTAMGISSQERSVEWKQWETDLQSNAISKCKKHTQNAACLKLSRICIKYIAIDV